MREFILGRFWTCLRGVLGVKLLLAYRMIPREEGLRDQLRLTPPFNPRPSLPEGRGIVVFHDLSPVPGTVPCIMYHVS